MAAVGSSPSGFSYAQAAKGRTSTPLSQQPSSKVTSGTATPATGALSELAPGSNWADEAEANAGDKAGDKAGDPPKGTHEHVTSTSAKEKPVERTKLEDKLVNGTSGVSSPELAASSTTTDDHSSLANNGSSSETTWETNSEPSWIAERNARQVIIQTSDDEPEEKEGKKQKKPKESAIPQLASTPVILQDAPPPTVNPWAKRAEGIKAKAVNQTPSLSKPASAGVAMPTTTTASKENQRPQPRKSNSLPTAPRVEDSPSSPSTDTRKSAAPQGKRASDVRISPLRQGSKPASDDAAKVAVPAARPTPIAAAPPPVKDQVSWPTPETAQEKERHDSAEKEVTEKVDDDATPTNKPRKKTAWATLAVTPTVVFETQNIKRGDGFRAPGGGERGGRGSTRARGSYRGGPNGSNGGDRPARRSEEDSISRGRTGTAERDIMPPSAKPNRASSASSFSEKTKDARGERVARGQSLVDTQPSNEATKVPNGETIAPAKSRHADSSKQTDAAGLEGKPGDRIREPDSRSISASTQTDVNGEPPQNAERGEPPVRMVPSEVRKESRTLDTPSRGAKRGGRGRGGSREFANGHQGNHSYINGQSADFAAAGLGLSPLSNGFQSRGNPQFSFPQQGRGGGGWSRGNPRSHSIPLDNVYGRFGPYTPNAQLPPVQTYVPGMYEYAAGYPMTAMPFTPSMESYQLVHLVRTQLDYYFSLDNLLKDIFLRKNMDSQGFVLLDTIAKFNRVKQLTQDKDILRVACLQSAEIEVRIGDDNKERLRRLNGWDQFVMPIDQRTAEAQHEGPQQLRVPETPSLPFNPPPFHGPASAGPQSSGPRFERRSYDGAYPMPNGYQPQIAGFPAVPESMYSEMLDNEDARGRVTKSPLHQNGAGLNQDTIPDSDPKDLEPDAFPDEAASVLIVVVKLKQAQPQRPPHHLAASRTFSNGSIDSRSIFSEMEKRPSAGEDSLKLNGEPSVNGTHLSPSMSRGPSPTKAGSSERNAAQSEIFWMKDQPKPVAAPPDVTMEPYVALRFKALEQRSHAATGTCPYDLEVLYQFWCHFLIRNFNSRMYNELKYFSNEDGKVRHNATGLQNLVRFYSQALLSHNPIRDRIVRDYLELVTVEPQVLEGMAFKTLRAAWRNGALNLKNRKKLADLVEGPLKERLDHVVEN